jgi:DNA-binding response OmpR family regulator
MVDPKNMRILISSSSLETRELLHMRFSIFGFLTEMAQSHEEAWNMIQNLPLIRILICEFNSLGVAEMLLLSKCKSKGQEVPRIYLINNVPNVANEIFLGLGAEGVIQRPFDARTLLTISRGSLLSFNERLRYPSYSAPTFDLQWTEGKNQNITLGRGGFCFKTTDSKMELNQVISFSIDQGQIQLVGTGLVKWVSTIENETWAGVEFTYLNHDSLDSLQQWTETMPVSAYIPHPEATKLSLVTSKNVKAAS